MTTDPFFEQKSCRSCNSTQLEVFHQLKSVPTNSCILLSSREEALHYPRGDITLAFCPDCGFISNISYDPKLTEYSDRYEETQGFSSTFTSFQNDLAKRLIDKYELHGKTIIEIGCGKGEFLTLLCEMGQNDGIGFDPTYISDRGAGTALDRITFVKDFYSEKYAHYSADFVCCKMTLEHIPHPYDFVHTIRNSIGPRPNTIVFFQVPDVTRILKKCAFEDIYYEHCSYFSPGSLARLLRKCGFQVLSSTTEYDDQYLIMEARPVTKSTRNQSEREDDLENLKRSVNEFHKKYLKMLKTWRSRLRNIDDRGNRAVLWGSGSKAVSFLTTLQAHNQIDYVVDINPHKHGFYMPGTYQQIVPPKFLKEYRPDTVIVMNSIYLQEIQGDIMAMGLHPRIIPV